MAVQLDPVYYTESMLKILRSQGSTQTAIELAEKMLAANPDQPSVRSILAELREETRLAFERFQQSSRMAAKSSQAEEN